MFFYLPNKQEDKVKNDACPFNGMKIAFNCIKMYFFPEWLTIGLFCLHVRTVPFSILAILHVLVLAHGSPRTNLNTSLNTKNHIEKSKNH